MLGIVDFHTHLFAAEVALNRDAYLRRDAVFRDLYTNPDAVISSGEHLIEAMDRAGVERSVVCGFGWLTNRLCQAGNDAIIEAVERHPSRLVGFGTVALAESVTEALREIERLARAGVRGLGELRPDAQGLLDLPASALAELAAAAREHGMMLLLHASEPVGHQYPGKEGATPERLEGFLSHFAGVTMVLAHAGGGLPFYAYMPEVKKALADVYVDTAALPYLYTPEVLRGLAHAIGAERVLFGSDYPLMPQERVLRYVDGAGLTQDERWAVLRGNAERLLARTGART
jgi:predicted TIM-barrel fold metal-dependent hydrolase